MRRLLVLQVIVGITERCHILCLGRSPHVTAVGLPRAFPEGPQRDVLTVDWIVSRQPAVGAIMSCMPYAKQAIYVAVMKPEN